MNDMKKPNILIFVPDGMNAGVVQPDSNCKTPNFDRLAGRGIRFNRAHTVNPVCSPARASLMTGLLPHNHGVLQVEHCVDDDQSVLRTEHPHWAQRLSDAGYRTGYFGKWHIERTNDLENFGWQVNGCDKTAAFRSIGEGKEGAESLLNDESFAKYTTTPEGYSPILHYGVTEVPTEQRSFARNTSNAREFIEESSRNNKEPWACCLSFPEPNVPVIAGKDAFEQYDIDSIKLPDNLNDDFANSPSLYRREKRILSDMTKRQWRELRAVYYALVTELDAQFGTLLDTLEKLGELDNTIIIVTSDHGRYIGEHGFDNHNFGAFEGAYNIPMIIAGPGIAGNIESAAAISLYDLCPTIIDLAGAAPVEGIDAKSFLPLLSKPESEAVNFTSSYAETHGTRFTLTQRILWDGNWKFVFNGFADDELYNLDDDPAELRNLAAEPDQQKRVREMMTKVWQEIKNSNDKALLGTHYSPMRFAAVGPNVI
jgi:arylsulfatase A-like enzyme